MLLAAQWCSLPLQEIMIRQELPFLPVPAVLQKLNYGPICQKPVVEDDSEGGGTCYHPYHSLLHRLLERFFNRATWSSLEVVLAGFELNLVILSENCSVKVLSPLSIVAKMLPVQGFQYRD